MKTSHKIHFKSSSSLREIPSGSVDLVVTSPPYPMIAMWDEMFCRQDYRIERALKDGDGWKAFDLMHRLLDRTWHEMLWVLREGGIACINIGDAVRTIKDDFQLYNSHSRILNYCLSLGFKALPAIVWRKPANSPNKFMGSGMLPAGAYVTLEHEFILVLRKGGKREFETEAEKRNRRESAIFWEERNVWFSDVWTDVKGKTQVIRDRNARDRSAAFPFEVAYRLVNMFSVKGDTVLDPFLGIGTTAAAAMASERNSIGFEIDESLKHTIHSVADGIVGFANDYIHRRLDRHVEFVKKRIAKKGRLEKRNEAYGFPCVSEQETSILLRDLSSIKGVGDSGFVVGYRKRPQKKFCGAWDELFAPGEEVERGVEEKAQVEMDF